MYRIAILVLFAISLTGCAAMRERNKNTSSTSNSKDTIIVQRFNRSPQTIEVPRGGLTLRQAVAIARDQTPPQQDVSQVVLNNGALFLGEIPAVEFEMKAGDEWFVLVRENQRFFLPDAVIANTAVGRVFLRPTDRLISVPYNSAIEGAGMWGGSEGSNMEITISTPSGINVVEASGDLDAVQNSVPVSSLLSENLLIELIAVTRVSDTTVDQLFSIPTLEVELPGSRTTRLGGEAYWGKNRPVTNFKLMDGDILEAIVAEEHPLVRQSLGP